jgi:Secretion system C-terminal sorting domain
MIKTLFATAAFTGSFFTTLTIPAITAVYDTKKKAVTIMWQQKTTSFKTFIVQRSSNNFNWVDIARVENALYSNNKTWQYDDKNLSEGENYYRLQCTGIDGKTTYSTSVMVITGSTRKWVMYPVPVTDVLTLQYKGTEKITGVIGIVIQNMNGYVLTRMRCASNTTVIQIPVSNLGKGVYDIRITIGSQIVWNQRFVK